MSGGRRVDLVESDVRVGDDALSLLRPREPEALLDETAFARDEFLPYWAELWPAAIALAHALPADLEGARVIEVGCGLAVPALVAAARGGRVTALDWAADAVDLARANAARNGLALDARVADWRELADEEEYDLALAADVLYERRNVDPLLEALPRLAPVTLLGLAGRPYERTFLLQTPAEQIADRVVRIAWPLPTAR